MPDAEAIKRQSVQGAIAYSIRTGLVYVISVGATAILSALLSPEQFGVFFIVTAIIAFFTFLSDVGLAATLVQKKTEPTIIELRTTFAVQQLLSFLIFGLIVVLTPLWRQQSHLDREGLWLLYALGFSFFLASLKTIPSILLERELEFQKLAIPQVIEQLLFYGTVVFLAFKGFGVTSFTVGVIVRGLAGVVVIYTLKQWPVGLAFNREALRELLRFGIKFQLNDLLARLKDDLYFVVLAKFLPVQTMGYLGWSKRWSMFPYQFSVQNIIAITFPTFSRVQENKTLVARGLEVSLYFIALIIFPILMGMTILAYPITVVIPVYVKWQPALPSLYFFCLNIALAAMANPFISALNAMGKITTTLRLMIIMTLLTWGLTPIAVRFFGPTGVAIVSSMVAGLSLLGYVILRRDVPVRLGSVIYVPLLSSVLMGIGVMATQRYFPPTWGYIFMEVVIGGLVYLGSLLLFGRKQLFDFLDSLLPRFRLRSMKGLPQPEEGQT